MDKWCEKCAKPCKQHMGVLIACPSFIPEFPDKLVFYGVEYTLTREQWQVVKIITLSHKGMDAAHHMKRFLINQRLAFEDN